MKPIFNPALGVKALNAWIGTLRNGFQSNKWIHLHSLITRNASVSHQSKIMLRTRNTWIVSHSPWPGRVYSLVNVCSNGLNRAFFSKVLASFGHIALVWQPLQSGSTVCLWLHGIIIIIIIMNLFFFKFKHPILWFSFLPYFFPSLLTIISIYFILSHM